MIIAWLLYASLVAAVVGIAALALERAARALGLPTRVPWLAAITFSTIWPAWVFARSAISNGAASGVVPGVAAVHLPPVLIAVGRDATSEFARHFPVASNRVSVAMLLAWLVITSVLLVRLVIGMWLIRRQRQSWTVREVDGVQVLITPSTGPAVIGLRRPAIVLPRWALALDAELRQIVLRHELEHVRARDTVLRLLGAIVTALMPWNIPLWWQADRVALAIEVDCDARVLRAHTGRERYGLLLLAVAQRQSIVMFAPALSEPTSHLERRIRAMKHATPRRPLVVAACLSAAAAISIALACEAPSPDAATSPRSEQSPPATSLSVTSHTATAPTRPYVAFRLSRQATPEPGGPVLRYPSALRAQGKEGTVDVQYVVDRTGAVDSATIKILRSTDPAFTAAVQEVLPRMHFRPAKAGGRTVKQLMLQPFMFRLQH